MILTVKKRNTIGRKRFVVSIITFAFVTSVLVVGSVGSLLQQTSARSNRNGYYSNQNRYDRNDRNEANRSGSASKESNSGNTSQRQSPTPTQTQKQQTPPAAPTAAATPTPPPTPQITQAPAIVYEAPEPVDTAADVTAMTTAQATTSGQTVAYTSQRISDETRDRLIALAGVALVTGGLLYTMSYFGAFSASRRPIPVRYIVPVREVATS